MTCNICNDNGRIQILHTACGLALKMKIYTANTAILVEKVVRTTNKMEWDTWFPLCTESIEKMDIGGRSLTPTISNRLQRFHRSIMLHWFSKIYRLQAATGCYRHGFQEANATKAATSNAPHAAPEPERCEVRIWNDLNAARGCLAAGL